ncbi:MAG TPA: pirin family protein [Thermoanaerobaculia bacterium]|nr:pirin family protein [Thermoanaerobaculia bacterium]
MIRIRRASERGHFDHGWLNTYHTFSFADYRDPAHMGFRTLRVINEDRVAPGQGFGAHRHRDMEIVSYVLEGALAHQDSMGNSGVIRPGDVQKMSAGTGVQHAEFNGSKTEPVHFLQIWILPQRRGIAPGYEQKTFPEDAKRGHLRLIGSPDGREGSVTIQQDVELYASVLDAGGEIRQVLRNGRAAWLQVARGELELNGSRLSAGDGAAITDEAELSIAGGNRSELLLFDLG